MGRVRRDTDALPGMQEACFAVERELHCALRDDRDLLVRMLVPGNDRARIEREERQHDIVEPDGAPRDAWEHLCHRKIVEREEVHRVTSARG